eukprot:262738-Prorocentrum_minimum.AAC.2
MALCKVASGAPVAAVLEVLRECEAAAGGAEEVTAAVINVLWSVAEADAEDEARKRRSEGEYASGWTSG